MCTIASPISMLSCMYWLSLWVYVTSQILEKLFSSIYGYIICNALAAH